MENAPFYFLVIFEIQPGKYKNKIKYLRLGKFWFFVLRILNAIEQRPFLIKENVEKDKYQKGQQSTKSY